MTQNDVCTKAMAEIERIQHELEETRYILGKTQYVSCRLYFMLAALMREEEQPSVATLDWAFKILTSMDPISKTYYIAMMDHDKMMAGEGGT